MIFRDTPAEATSYLRKALPMMVKHNITPNPINYALWYSYFSNDYPGLKVELEETIKEHGTCPPELSGKLFVDHIGDKANIREERLKALQEDFSNVVNGLSNSINITSQETCSHSDALLENLASLGEKDVGDELAADISQLTANASLMCASHNQFQSELVEAQNEIKALKEKLEEASQDAKTDPLTGLFNRRQFGENFELFVNKNDGLDITLIMMDIDKFKSLNDTYGHSTGDLVLKFIGKFLKESCKEPLTPFRLGGEEFAILCPNLCIDKAETVAENIRKKLSSSALKSSRTGVLIPAVTASFGVAQKKDNESLDHIVERADIALYKAKNDGRNQVKLSV